MFPVSFANFASIGIVAGAIKGLNEQQGNVVSRFGLRLVYGATLVSLLSASFAGLVIRCDAGWRAAIPAHDATTAGYPAVFLKLHTHRLIDPHHRLLRKAGFIDTA